MTEFRRGFKSWCETTALQFRTALGLAAIAPLPAGRLARHVGALVVDPTKIPGLGADAIQQLVNRDPDSWSAVTISAYGRHVIVVNPSHSPGRTSNDVMHECSHLILNHRPAKAALSEDGQLLMSAYDKQQEAEANWLAAALLLPRTALVAIAMGGMEASAVARHYVVSEQLLTMRINRTGVRTQFLRKSA